MVGSAKLFSRAFSPPARLTKKQEIGERQPDVLFDRHPEEACAALVFSDREQCAPEWRAQQQAHCRRRQSEHREDEVVEQYGLVQNVGGPHAQIQRLALEAAQPVVTAGQRVPAKGNEVEHLTEGDGHHGEVDAAPAHDQSTEQCSGDTTKHGAEQQRERRAVSEQLQRQAGAVSAETEVGSVAEREHAGEAQTES